MKEKTLEEHIKEKDTALQMEINEKEMQHEGSKDNVMSLLVEVRKLKEVNIAETHSKPVKEAEYCPVMMIIVD